MKKSRFSSRRDFLKTAAAGTVGIAISAAGLQKLFASASGGMSWSAGLKINPAIDNLSVVCCYDEGMLNNKIAYNFAAQNSSVQATVIQKNMDDMAIKLINGDYNTSAETAWKKIFMKPAAKQWSEVKAAIKVDCSNIQNMPRAAVVGKVCSALMLCGVLPSNITIYDSLCGAWGKYCDAGGNPVSGIPAGVNIHNLTHDGPEVPVGTGSMQCSSVIAKANTDSSISYITDILVNCAANNGDDTAYGGFSMCMKNHTGTLKYSPPATQELVDQNQCEAIIGAGTADIPCRQQLCLVDSLWACASGPGGAWSHVPCCIVMGMLAPVVDYLIAEKIRKASNVMNAPYNTTVVYDWLSQFGYPKPTDLAPGWKMISPSTGVSRTAAAGLGRSTTVRVSLCGNSPPVEFAMPLQNLPVFIDVFDLRGRRVRNITLPPNAEHAVSIAWNGVESSGNRIIIGRYAVKCTMGNTAKIAMAQVVR